MVTLAKCSFLGALPRLHSLLKVNFNEQFASFLSLLLFISYSFTRIVVQRLSHETWMIAHMIVDDWFAGILWSQINCRHLPVHFFTFGSSHRRLPTNRWSPWTTWVCPVYSAAGSLLVTLHGWWCGEGAYINGLCLVWLDGWRGASVRFEWREDRGMSSTGDLL